MEKVNPGEQKNLIIELTHGREMANELRKQLDPVTSPETCEALVEKIVSTYEKALAMLTWRVLKEEEALPETGTEESPLFRSPVLTSPITEGSNSSGFSKDQECNKDASRKRKTLPKWSEHVRVFSPSGLEGHLDDGHSWRKYGQKDILGANFPRAYYRCTHRNSRGCLATKQVQRSDEDPSVFEVTYKGRHSCIQAANSGSAIRSDAKEMHKPKKARSLEKEEGDQRGAEQMLQHLGQGLKVETEVSKTKEEIFRSFSFSFKGVESEILESQFFSDVMKDCDMMGSNSPTFLSPTTSGSNYFSSSCQMDNNFGIDNILQTSESDLTDMISTPTSVISSSPFGDPDFSIDQVDFDPSFTLDDHLAYFN